MGKFIEMVGKKFGRLSVLERDSTGNNGAVTWKCRCDCGNIVSVNGSALRNGHTSSCGCYQKDIATVSAKQMGQKNTRHGMSYERIHGIWRGMKQRCSDPNSDDYKNYGARGITVCPEWSESFEAFRDWALANGYRDDLTIDRIDNDGPYAPENCRWATGAEQNNNRRNTRLVTFNGKTQSLQQWANETDIPRGTIAARLRTGWSVERALTEPIHEARRPKHK